jgi:uncharacterized protein (DUF1501 family)
MPISRRKFIQLGSLASASLMVPKFLKGFQYSPAPLATNGNKVLIVVQLSGGNDSLNMIIPYRNDIYYRSRPKIGIQRQDALELTDEVGVNPSLRALKGLYDNGNVAVLNGVGYPHPDRSHFRSMDIWQSGSTARDVVTTGWLGRYLDGAAASGAGHNARALEIDETLSLAMKGERQSALAVNDIARFHQAAANNYFKKIITHEDSHEAELASYLYRTLRETTSAADYIYDRSKIYTTTQTYPDTNIGKRMKTIGSLIISGSETQVYYVAHGSFDTHVDQSNRQGKLLEQLDGALDALVRDLKANGRMDDVLIMTFSEFGRRVAQNASNGTDHGTAGSMLLIGGGLKKAGIYNPIPDLADLDEGDLKYSVDFKEVYATVLESWLQADSREILGKRYSNLGII